MTTQSANMPSERDVIAVEQRLAALYEELPPAQQAVLDTIIAAGLTVTTAGDTSGYSFGMHPVELEMVARARIEEIREDFQRVNAGRDVPTDAAAPRPRWNLRPLLEWFRRAPAAQPQAGTPGSTPA